MIFSATFALTLLLTNVAHALPHPSHGSASIPPPSLTSSTYSSTPSLSPSPSSTTVYYPKSCNVTNPEPSTLSATVRATFDATYDNSVGSLNNVACSNGANGLVSRFPTFGNIPTFPFIGGAPGIAWNSPKCGGCWKLTNKATGATIIMTAIDSAATFNLAKPAFETLNGGEIGKGVFDVVADEIPRWFCGL